MKRKSYRRRMRHATPEERQCTRKVRFPTQLDARLNAQKAMYLSHGRTSIMWIYPCDLCDGWHTSTKASGPLGRVTIDALAPNGVFE